MLKVSVRIRHAVLEEGLVVDCLLVVCLLVVCLLVVCLPVVCLLVVCLFACLFACGSLVGFAHRPINAGLAVCGYKYIYIYR